MSFLDNYTEVVDGQVEFAGDDGENLVDYCNRACAKQCEVGSQNWTIDDPPACDCEVSRLYWAMVKLAEWEHRGMTFEEYCKITPLKKG